MAHFDAFCVDVWAVHRQIAAMTKVRFDPAQFEVSVSAPASLIDVTDEHPDTDVPFSCRSASCEDELEVLRIFEDGENVRLCCQLELVKDVETLHLRVVDP